MVHTRELGAIPPGEFINFIEKIKINKCVNYFI